MPPRKDPPASPQPPNDEAAATPAKRNILAPVLLLLITLLGSGAGLFYLRGKQKSGSVEKIREAGGVVSLNQDAEGTFATVDLRDTEGEFPDLASLNDYFPIEKLRLPTSTTDADLATLSGLQKLVVLSLAGSEVSDEGLSTLADLRSLDSLNLEKTNITDTGLSYLKGLSQLVLLDVSNTKITSGGLTSVGGLTKLEFLELHDTSVDDAGLAAIKSLESLRELSLDATQVSDAGLAHLSGMKKLRRLSLRGTGVTDAGVMQVQDLPNMEELVLDETKVSPALVEKLQTELARTEIQGRFQIENNASRDLYLGFVGKALRGQVLRGGMSVAAPEGSDQDAEQSSAPGVHSSYSWKKKVGTYRHHSLPKGQYLVYLRSGNFYDWRWVSLDGSEPHRRLDFIVNGGNAATINVSVPQQEPPTPLTFMPLVLNREGGSNEEVPISLGIGVLPKEGNATFRVSAGKYRLGLTEGSTTVFVKAKETQQVELK